MTPSPMASLSASMLAATMIWLANLVTPPAPISPVSTTLAPMIFIRSIAACLPAAAVAPAGCPPSAASFASSADVVTSTGRAAFVAS